MPSLLNLVMVENFVVAGLGDYAKILVDMDRMRPLAVPEKIKHAMCGERVEFGD